MKSGLWEGYFKNVILASFIHSTTIFDVLFGAIVLLERPNCLQSSWWFEVVLKKVILLLHFSLHFVQYTLSTDSKSASEHDATTTLLNSWCSVRWVEYLTFTTGYCGQINLKMAILEQRLLY